MDSQTLQPNIDLVSLDSWETPESSWLPHTFSVFFSVLQSKPHFSLDEDDTDFYSSAKITGTTEGIFT